MHKNRMTDTVVVPTKRINNCNMYIEKFKPQEDSLW